MGPYRIASLLGKGGMGEVYRAHERGLERQVALKVLRGDDAQDATRVARFKREAASISKLSHPGIVAIFKTAETTVNAEAVFYIAMELIEGPSLQEELAKGRPTLKRTLDLTTGIAEALAFTHAAGICHRDLKPSNILITEEGEGHPKVVDFGLAKHGSDGAGGPAAKDALTSSAEVVGTAGYMSPEQARGDEIKAQSDQFSFGCILYEMLTGRRAFHAASFAETLSSILRDQPAPVESIEPTVPVPLRWIVARCLDKSPTRRYASTQDLARDLRMLAESYSELVSGGHVPPPPRRLHPVIAVAGVIALAVAAAALAWPRPPPRAQGLQFRPLTFRSGFVARALFTPRSNGILVAASWDGQPLRMYQTTVESVGFDRSLDSPVQFPLAYSEDGAQVLVLLGVARDANVLRGTLAWWPATGGTPRPLVEDAGWSDWAPRSRQLAVVRDTGTSRVLELRDETGRVMRALFSTPGAIAWVRFSPNEDRIAFVRLPSPRGTKGEVWSVDVATGDARALTPLMSQCRGLDWQRATGEIWFTASRDNPWASTLWRLRSDGTMDHVQSLSGVHHLHAIDSARSEWLINSHKADSDIVVSVPPRPPERRSWFGWSVASDVSPDATSYLFSDGGAGENTWGLWVRPMAGGDAFRIGAGLNGRFSPDGRWVVATGDGTDERAQIVLLSVGAGESRTITAGTASYSSPSFAGADAVLAVRQDGATTNVVRVHLGDGRVEPLGIQDCDMPSASPGAASIACVADAGRTLRLQPLDGSVARVLATVGQGRIRAVRWNRNGRDIYVVTSDRRLLTVDASRGQLVKDEDLAYTGGGPYDHVIGAALDSTGRSRVYSIARQSSILYVGTPEKRGE